MVGRIVVLAALLELVGCGAGGPTGALPDETDPIQPDAALGSPDAAPPAPLRLHQLQAKGTHNSYHVATFGVPIVPDWNYTHAPLDEQLESEGVRQVELDLQLGGLGDHFEVYHVPGVDEQTTCRLLVDCLGVIKSWSDAHPAHHPLAIMVEPKYEFIEAFADQQAATLEDEILSVWPRERIITPDDVKGGFETLREAVTEVGWPTIDESRGKVLFFVDDSEGFRDHYTMGGTTLDGRLMFIDSPFDAPYAAVRVLNDPVFLADAIEEAASANMLVRTRLDRVVDTSVELDPAKVDAALVSPAHFLTTDVREFVLPEGEPSRCNPLTAPAHCTNSLIEDL